VLSQSQSAITLQWTAPVSNGGCNIEGYRIQMEDIMNLGYRTVYNGITLPTVTKFTISSPNILPSKTYRFLIQSKNCGRFSAGLTMIVKSGSVPSRIAKAPMVVSYDSSSDMTISWEKPSSNGGFAILNYKVYVDNVPITV
jgi:hypothetical protein